MPISIKTYMKRKAEAHRKAIAEAKGTIRPKKTGEDFVRGSAKKGWKPVKPVKYFSLKTKMEGYQPMLPEQFNSWKDEYRRDWQTFELNRGANTHLIDIANKLLDKKDKYLNVQRFTGVPWYWIAAIHNRESDANFRTHLHNGDPLSAKTFHVPAGRPLVGNPPYSWESSAIDALELEGYTTKTDWSIEEMMYRAELYNGLGPRRRGIKTGYLWSYTNKYTMGKYVADGRWNGTTVDVQMGVVPIFLALAKRDPTIKYYFEPDGTAACEAAPMVYHQ